MEVSEAPSGPSAPRGPMNVVQDSYESVISLDVDMEPPRGQLEPPQGLATTPWSQGLLLPDFRKQLMAIMQTIGQSQVEKMLRELVKEQKQEGRVQWCRRPVKSLGSGAGSRTQKVKEEVPPQDGGVEPTGAWGMFSGMPRGSEQHPALAAQQGPEEAPESPPAAPHGKPARAGALGKARDVPTPPKRWPEEQGRGWGAGCKEGCVWGPWIYPGRCPLCLMLPLGSLVPEYPRLSPVGLSLPRLTTETSLVA
nr:PREDICTED: uncharacterized protein LOC104144839 [Struthio camelus australis]